MSWFREPGSFASQLAIFETLAGFWVSPTRSDAFHLAWTTTWLRRSASESLAKLRPVRLKLRRHRESTEESSHAPEFTHAQFGFAAVPQG